jgi:hypothetical protein
LVLNIKYPIKTTITTLIRPTIKDFKLDPARFDHSFILLGKSSNGIAMGILKLDTKS